MEVLFRIVDKGVAIDCEKLGDVITVQPNGWGWTPAELSNPDWRIVSVPILQTTADALLQMYNPNNVKAVKRFREWGIDLTKLPNPSLYVGARTQGIISITKAQALAAVVKKP